MGSLLGIPVTGEGRRIAQREELDRDAVTAKALLIPRAALGLGWPVRAALNWARGPSFGAHTSASSWLLREGVQLWVRHLPLAESQCWWLPRVSCKQPVFGSWRHECLNPEGGPERPSQRPPHVHLQILSHSSGPQMSRTSSCPQGGYGNTDSALCGGQGGHRC